MIVLDRMVRPLGGFGEALERLFGDLGFVSERFEKLLGGFVASRGYIGRFWEASQRIWGNFGEVSAWSAGRWPGQGSNIEQESCTPPSQRVSGSDA